MQSIFLHIHWECSIQWSQQIRAVVVKWLRLRLRLRLKIKIKIKTTARGRSGVLRAQPEVVHAHGLRN